MFTINDINIYIFCWKKVVGNSLALYEEISKVCPNTHIINCDENTQMDQDKIKHIQLDDSYYYGGQFEAAIKAIPTGRVMACLTGDVSPVAAWGDIVQKAVDAFNTGKVGVFAPDVDYTYWTKKKRQLWGDLWEVENTDCTVWFIHPSIIEVMRPIPFKKICHFGWGTDAVVNIESNTQNLLVARDYSVKVIHPHETGYDQPTAHAQMYKLINIFLQYKSNPSVLDSI